jgi:hypothetical protein
MIMAENTNQNVTNNGTNGANGAQDNQVKKTLKERVNDALNKEHKFTIGGIVKGVAFVAAIPVAFVIGKTVQKQQDNELLDLTASDPEPAALPDNQNGNTEVETAIDVEYDEVTTD